MSTPKPGQETAQAVLDQIRMHPETHDQGSFEVLASCGTTRCIAGWACHMHGYDVQDINDEGSCSLIATRLLGLEISGEDERTLFFGTNEREAVHALEFLAKGEVIDWTEVFDRRHTGE